MGSRHHRRGRVRSLQLGWRRVAANGDGSCCSAVLGRVSPDLPGRRSYCHRERLEDASGGSSVHPFDRSLGFGACAGSRLGRLPCLVGAAVGPPCRERGATEGHHVAAHKEHAGNEAPDRLAEDGRRRSTVPQWAARSSLAHSRFFQSQSHVPSLWPTGSFGKGSKTRSTTWGLYRLVNKAPRR